jgi:hypothetical protein
MDADWIVAEVEEVIARGKTVPFRELSREENDQYESRLIEEADRGIAVARARANEFIGVPYEPQERLRLLVEAIERVISASELALSSISKFASQLDINSIDLESPLGTNLASTPRVHSVPLDTPTLTNERLSILRSVLRDEVLS